MKILWLLTLSVFVSGFGSADPLLCPKNLKKGDICKIEILSLHPTQFAVGFLAVKDKQEKFKDKGVTTDFLVKHLVPVVLGPGKPGQQQTLYISDDHHFLTALHRMRYKFCYIKVEHDFRDEPDFWKKMQASNTVWPYTEDGKPTTAFDKIPETVALLKDDPLRSLVYFLQEKEYIDKVDANFSQFKWANFLRDYIGPKLVSWDIDYATKVGGRIAESDLAKGLPGYLRHH